MSDGLKLISALIASGSGATLGQVDRECLLDQELAAWDYTKRHFRQYRQLPTPQTVQEETSVRLPVATESLQYYIDQVSERHEYNLIRDRFAVLRQQLQERNMAQVANSVSSMARVLRRRSRGAEQSGQSIDLTDAGRLVYERLEAIRGTGGVSGITTGWRNFDYITGGYQNADLITWVGRMGIGKTYLILQQAKSAHEAGHNVLFITTEMGVEPISRRYAALATGINPRLLRDGTISTYMLRRIQGLYREIQGAERFKIFAVGMAAKMDAIYALIQEVGPSIVFIDGVYLLRPTEISRSANRTERVTAVYDELRALTLESNIPYVVTTQFNRQAGKGGKEGTLENIGFTDAIGTHSSIVIAAKFGPTQVPTESRVFEFMKGREGESGEVVINFKFAPLNLNEMSPEEREAEGDAPEATVEWMGGRRRTDRRPE